MAGDWSQLPKELLQLISKKLDNSELYLIRFRSVCSSWRSSSIPNYSHNNHLPLNLPQFPDSVGSVVCILSKHNIFFTPSCAQLQPALCLQSWTCVLHERLLPNSWTDVYLEKVVVATSQEEQPLDIVTHNKSGETTVFRCGENHWTKNPNVAKSHEDICIFKGRPCVVDKTDRTVMIGSDLSVHLVAEPLIGGDIKFLLESECELLLVDRYIISNGDDGVRIDVFRLNECFSLGPRSGFAFV